MKEHKEKPLHAKVLESLLDGHAKLFHDQYQETYLSPDGTGRQVLLLKSRTFHIWLGQYCFTNFSEVLNSETALKVVNTLSGLALFDSEMIELNIRSVMSKESLWYDLGGSAVKVTADKWQIVDKPEILFKRMPHQNDQVVPISSTDIDAMRPYLNLKTEDDYLLFIVYLIAAFVPGFPHPLLVIHGSQGAGKTTPMRILKALIDPSQLQGLPPPAKPDDFIHVATKHHFLFYDNLSSMPGWLSDTLARACTGDSFSKRALYSDDDDVIYSFQRTIAINGINQVITRSDLLDRAILLNLERISQEKRIEETVFWNSFNDDKSKILGSIFTILSEAIRVYPTVQLSALPRMADFYKWGCAITIAMGRPKEDFTNAYILNVSSQHDEAIEASPVAQAIIKLMSTRKYWEGTPSELLDCLNDLSDTLLHARNAGLPQHPNWLSRSLTTLQPNLLARGLIVERLDNARPRKIIIKAERINTVDTDLPTAVTKVFGNQIELLDNGRQYDNTDSKL